MTTKELEYAVGQDEAVEIARALICYNRYLFAEYEKIALAGDDVSDFIKEAARNQYNELSTKATQLHTRLADTFPALRQA